MNRLAAIKTVFGGEAKLRLLRCLYSDFGREYQLRALANEAGVDAGQAHKLMRKFVQVGLSQETAQAPLPRYKATADKEVREALSRLVQLASEAPDGPMRRIDERSLRLHQLAVERLCSDPNSLDRAKQTLHRWMSRYGEEPPTALSEWRQILSQPLQQVIETALQRTQYGDRLRKSSPLSTLVTTEERRRAYAAD